MNFLKIAWNDISSIFKNRFIRVSVVAIIIVPLLYSLLFLAAFWDPYTRLKSMHVAVVNLDKGSTKDGEQVNYGKEITDKLKDNTEVGWQFTSYDDAKEGLEGKKYYAMFVIPDDFSSKITSSQTSKPVAPAIMYSSNDKKNFIAAQIDGKVEVMLKAEIIKSMTEKGTTVVFDKLTEIKDGMIKAADGSLKLADGNKKLNDKIPEMKDGVGKLVDGSSQLADGIGTLKDKLPEMKDGVGQLANGSGQIADGNTQLSQKINDEVVPKVNEAKAFMGKNKDLMTLLNEQNLKAFRTIMNNTDVIMQEKSGVPQLLVTLTGLMDAKTFSMVDKTMKDVKIANLDALMHDDTIKSALSLIATQDNRNKINKIVYDASSALEQNKAVIQPLVGVSSNLVNLQTLVKDADGLYKGLDQDKIKPLLTLMSQNDKLEALLADAQVLNKIDQKQLQPLMNLMAHKDALFTLLADSNTLMDLNNDDAMKPVKALMVTDNQKAVTELLKDMPALATIDLNGMKATLDEQKKGAAYFVKTATDLNKDEIKKALAGAIATNDKLTDIQKAQLSAALKGYEDLTAGTAASMLASSSKIDEMETTLTGLGTTQAHLKSALPLMQSIPGTMDFMTNKLMPQLGKVKAELDGAKALTNGLGDSINYVSGLKPGIDKAQADMVAIMPYLQGVPESMKYANGALPQVNKIIGKLGANKNSIDTLKAILLNMDATALQAQIDVLQKDLADNKENIAQAQALLVKMNQPAMQQSIQQSIQGLNALSSDLDNAKPIIDKLNANLANVDRNNLPMIQQTILIAQKELTDNKKLLEVAKNQLTDSNIAKAKNIIAALPTTFDSVNKLQDATTRLADGSVKLNNGILTLKGKLPALQDGTQKLADGSVKLRDGIGTLNGKIPELQDGTQKLADGSKELSDKLGDASTKLNKSLVNTSADMGKFMSEPVIMDEKPLYSVKNYGTGFAPYFIPLAMWVGALMMFFVITGKVDNELGAGPLSVVSGKYISYCFIGLIQAVLSSVVVLTLGLRPANLVLYFLFNIFMSFVFISIIQCLVFLLGEVGRLLAIALLILQLTSCAGTFPIEVVPTFFKVLNPLMPFTYCVSAIRETISGADYAVFGHDVFVLACMMVGFLFISVVMKEHADKAQARVREMKEESLDTM